MTDKYAKGTTQGKIGLLLFIIITFLVYVLLKYMIDHYITGQSGSYTEKALHDYSVKIANVGIYISLICLCYLTFVSYYFFKLANAIKRSQQWPPPDAKIPFTTKIVSGKKAFTQAYACYGISMVLILAGIFYLGVNIHSAKSLYKIGTDAAYTHNQK